MNNVSEERAKQDEMELYVYGVCSTQIYVDFRERIDYKLKFTMAELAKYYEECTELNEDRVNEMLFKQYKAFWALAESSFQKFYEEVQNILALPRDCNLKDISPKKVFCARQIEAIDAEIEALQEKFEAHTYVLHELKYRQELLDTFYQLLKDQVDSAKKAWDVNMKSFKCLLGLDKKREEMMQKFMEHVDKKTLSHFVAKDIETDNEQAFLEKFAKINVES